MMRTLLTRSSHKAQHKKVNDDKAASRNSGRVPGNADAEAGSGERLATFRLLEAANNTAEETFMTAMGQRLQDSEYWSIIPRSNMTVQINHLAFKMCSAAVAVVRDTEDCHNNYPYKILKCYNCRETAEEVVSDRKCRLCTYGRSFRGAYGTVSDIMSGDAQAELETVLELGDDTIASLEAKHASNRRSLHVMSTQTWQTPIEDLSALFIVRFCRVVLSRLWAFFAGLSWELVGGTKEVQTKSADRPTRQRRKKRKHGGGAWRAFVHFFSNAAKHSIAIQ